jgi:hypothetical protein
MHHGVAVVCCRHLARRAKAGNNVNMTSSLKILVTALIIMAIPARAASETELAFTTTMPVQLNYSQGTSVSVRLTRGGVPVVGANDCGLQACAVTLRMTRTDGVGQPIDITEPDVAIDAQGIATIRITVVDGRYGGAVFAGSPEGVSYDLQARFRGAGEPTPAECDDNAGLPDLCASSAVGQLVVRVETPRIALDGSQTIAIGDEVTIAATLTDPTGIAEPTGDDVDGPSESLIFGRGVVFFYDVNDDGAIEPAERLNVEAALTNQAGVASFTFTASPEFVQAGIFDQGLVVEFPGDEQYGVARASTSLTVTAGRPDPASTIITATPDVIPANGVSIARIQLTLVDAQRNILGADAEPVTMVLTTDLGQLLGEVERDVLDGTYSQELRSTREGGQALVTATLDGQPAGEIGITIEAASTCACTQVRHTPSMAAAVMVIATIAIGRRRRVLV